MVKYLWKTIHYTMGTESILQLELKSRISALIATFSNSSRQGDLPGSSKKARFGKGLTKTWVYKFIKGEWFQQNYLKMKLEWLVPWIKKRSLLWSEITDMPHVATVLFWTASA